MILLQPDKIPTEWLASPSKSHLQRELLLSLCANHTSTLEGNFTHVPEDVQHALGVIKSLGCAVIASSRQWQIFPPTTRKKVPRAVLNVGESGFLFRSILSIGFLFAEELELHAKGSLVSRHLPTLSKDLQALGVTCLTPRNQWPMILSKKEPWSSSLVLNASGTSQVASGVLMMMAASEEIRQLSLVELVSRPYLDFTLNCLKHRGVTISRDLDLITIDSTGYSGGTVKIQGDWSGAANWLCIGAMTGGVVVQGLALYSSQADERILEVLNQYGAEIHTESEQITVQKNANRSFEVDITDSPDLFPVLSVLAASAQGVSRIIGTKRLSSKESNRLVATQALLNALGVINRTGENELYVTGGMNYRGAVIDSFRDHRIILATMVAVKGLNIPVAISSTEEVSKSIKGLNFL